MPTTVVVSGVKAAALTPASHTAPLPSAAIAEAISSRPESITLVHTVNPDVSREVTEISAVALLWLAKVIT